MIPPMRPIAAALFALIVTSAAGADTPAPPKPPNIGWVAASLKLKNAEKLVLMQVRNEIPSDASPASYPTMVEIHWKFEPDAQGMPPERIATQQDRFQADLDPIQGDHLGYLMMIATGNGERIWVWYVADPKTFGDALNRLIPGHPFPVTVNVAASEPDWKRYRAMRERIH
jgi:hypothetical protein